MAKAKKKVKKTEPEKPKSRIESIVAQFDKLTKKEGNIMILGDDDAIADIPVNSSGIFSLDKILGVGGYPHGRIIEIYGPEMSGKTSLCLQAVAAAQRAGGVAAFLDLEHALDKKYAASLGVDLKQLLFSQPDSAEEGLGAAEQLSKLLSGGDLIIVDSVAALTPQAELDGNMGDHHVGLQARLMGQAMRKLNGAVAASGVTIMFINQLRMKIGVMFGCFHYDTLVNFVDGRSIPIGRVVDEGITGDVYCLNKDTEQIETKPIIGWHDNGKVERHKDFIHIQTESIGGGGRFGFTCTPNHRILTGTGWKRAKDISFEDKLISRCMQYKLPEAFRGRYEEFGLYNALKLQPEEVAIREIRYASDRQMRNKRKFDISVEGNRNYMVGGINNGVVVHNSPETTTGGNALKFYASQRIDIRRIGMLKKDGQEPYGAKTRIKVVKNKVAPPLRECELEMIFGEGIPKYLDLFNNAVKEGFIEHLGGGRYYMDGESYCHGKAATIEKFKEDTELMANIEQRLRSLYLKK